MSNPEFKAIPVRPCVKCGACERDKRGQCKACLKATTTAWRALNPDRVKASYADWKSSNTERLKEYETARRAANPEKSKADSAAWRKQNPERHRANVAAWAKQNPERVREYCAAWRTANPEAVTIYHANRRAREKTTNGKLSTGLAANLFKLQKGKCPCCKQPLGDGYHLDHIKPLALGGLNTDDNIQLLRATCNLQKSMKHPVDFMQSRGFLL